MTGARKQVSSIQPKPGHKLKALPPNAKVTKRPLIRPPIASPYASASIQKVVYVSCKTPFMSAVKRVQKLLRLSEKRLIQSATTLQKQKSNEAKRSRNEDYDEIGEIARLAEKQKAAAHAWRRKGVKIGKASAEDVEEFGGEQVVLKATGKAIQKAMQLGLWFLQRDDEFQVQLRTGSVGAIDDIEVEHDGDVENACNQTGAEQETSGKEDIVAVTSIGPDEIMGNTEEPETGLDRGSATQERGSTAPNGSGEQLETSGARIRYTSVLEVAVSLR